MPYWRYRLHWTDGDDAGEAESVDPIKPGELVWLHDGRQVRVVDVVETPDADRYEGLLIDGRDCA